MLTGEFKHATIQRSANQVVGQDPDTTGVCSFTSSAMLLAQQVLNQAHLNAIYQWLPMGPDYPLHFHHH